MRHGKTLASTALAFLAVLTMMPATRSAIAGAPLPDERLGIRTAPLLLLSRPDVRADLGLSARQAEDAEKAITELYLRALALRGKSGEQVVRGRQAIDEATRVWFETHLTPEQRNRLVQVDLQWEGPSSLVSRPVVADTLGLTPEQRASLKQAVAQSHAARAGGTPVTTVERELARQALALLTPAQKERWRIMLGRPVAFQLAATQPDASRTTR
jgi:hypothetical protein